MFGRWMFSLVSLFAVFVADGCASAPSPHVENAPSVASAPPACLASESEAKHAWEEFRAAYPFHAQTIALSDPFGEGCRVVVIAEPPPSLEQPRLAGILPPGTTPPTPRHHTIGHDGWTTDLTAVLPPLSLERVQMLVSVLSQTMFGTTYKAYATPIGAVPPSATNISLQLSPADISRWLLERDVILSPVEPGTAMPLTAALAGKADGAYFTDTAGIVVWAMPRPASLDQRSVAARQFSLDSDLILGAIASPQEVVIVARERATPVDRVPPLRYETMTTLASASGSELGQSYERTNVLAGRFDGTHDWAPIYLSPELVDTEFGSLLNIADQLLKGDSNAGETAYANFDYPPPLWWPFPIALPSYLHADSLTYNWNTDGVGAIADTSNVSVYWVRDTGALPVTYLPEDVESTEATRAAIAAHDYFSAQEDPQLVRVVQYSSIYQIFRAFDVTATPAHRAGVPASAGEVLESATFDALARLSKASDDDVRAAVARELGRHGLATMDSNGPTSAAVGTLIDVIGLSNKLEELAPTGLHAVAHSLANPDRDLEKLREKMLAGVELTEEEQTKLVGVLLAKNFEEYQDGVKAFVPDLTAVRDAFSAASLVGRDPTIRTPTIVVSSNRGALKEASGGHNIDASVPRVRLRGGGGAIVSMDGETHDLGGVRSLRDVGLTADGRIQSIAPTTPRPLGAVLKREGGAPGSPRGFVVRADGKGVMRDAREPAPRSWTRIEKTASGFAVTDGEGTAVHAGNRVELLDAVAARASGTDDSVVFEFSGLREDEVRGLVRSTELKLRRGVVGLSEEGGGLRSARLKWGSVEESPPSVQTLADGRAVAEFRVFAEAPRQQTFVGRLRLFFSKSAVGRAAGRIQEIAQLAMRRLKAHFGGYTPSLSEAALELKRDLRRFDAGIEVKVDVPGQQTMASDFLVATVNVGRGENGQ